MENFPSNINVGHNKSRCSSRLVGDSLVNFQRKVAQIVESICLTFNDLYLVIHPFEFPGVNGVVAVVENTVAMSFKHVGKVVHRRLVYCAGQ